jgi:3-phosphoshikimate 1-carboxyvinyltransferase
LHIFGKKLKGTSLKINGEVSSQFISALCLIAPTLPNGLSLEIQKDIVSLSYIEMTLKLMAQFGIQSSFNHNCIHISPQSYPARSMNIESDWSSACFFYAMAMVSNNSEMQLRFLEPDSLQGDAFIYTLAEDFGIQSVFGDDHVLITKNHTVPLNSEEIYDLSSYPDLAIPLIVACAIKFPQVRFTGLGHLRYKESDRLQALQVELRKMGIILQEDHEVLSIDNSNYLPSRQRIELDTYHDHRLAMAFCLFALEGYAVVLNDAACVKKSFPGYFEQLQKIGFDISHT